MNSYFDLERFVKSILLAAILAMFQLGLVFFGSVKAAGVGMLLLFPAALLIGRKAVQNGSHSLILFLMIGQVVAYAFTLSVRWKKTKPAVVTLIVVHIGAMLLLGFWNQLA